MLIRDDIANERVLVLMPTQAEAARTAQWLEDAELCGQVCADHAGLARELACGAGALLLSDDVLLDDEEGVLAAAVGGQSEVPVIVLASRSPSQLLPCTGSPVLQNAIVVEGSRCTPTLLSVISATLRARRAQEALRADVARHAEELRQAEQLRHDFLATLAHELRNPLAPIRTGTDLLSTGPQSEVAARTLGVMQRQLGHMVRLIDDLLDVSRITQGKLELKRERVTVGAIVDAALEASRPFVEQGKHSLRVSVVSEPLWLDADAIRVVQALSNLLHNATKYTAPNGHISLLAYCQGSDVVIEIEDDGLGISPERLEDVFEMYNQVNRAQGGLGIGLSLVRRLIEMHGGTVQAHSAGLGQGSTFTVRLPLASARASEQAAQSHEPTERPSQPMKRILVVDDNDDAADLLSLMLEHAGHETTTAHDGPSALAAVQTWSPEIVFLDIGLPGMNGYEVARQLRHDPRYSTVGLIALTGWGTREDKRKADDAGFDVHLTKPVDARVLRSVLDELVARGR